MNLLQRLGAEVKQAVMRWTGSTRTWFGWGLGGTRFDYHGQARPDANAIVQASVLWLARTFPEAPVRVRARKRNGDLEPVVDHPLVALLDRPNPYYAGHTLWHATLADWVVDGNAYWLKARSSVGRAVELWWLPARLVEPVYPDDGRTFLTGYSYRVGAEQVVYAPEDVVHFRYGIDPDNPRKGLSPLKSLVREVFTDDEAANFSASLLRNLGVPGLVVSPDADDANPDQTELERVKAEFAQRFGGDNRGSTVVMKGKTKIDVLSFNPQEMDLKTLRRLPEERVTAVLGIPAVVVGLGAGLDRSTFANYEEARQAAYESNVIPTQRLFAAELRAQLLPDFAPDPSAFVVDFDLAEVRVLQPDLDKLFTRLDTAVRGGWMMPNEAREKVGLDPLEGGDVVYVPSTLKPTDPADLIPAPEPPPQMAPPPDQAPPTALNAPRPVRALPPAKAASFKSAADHTADALWRLRDRQYPLLERELAHFLANQGERMAGVVHGVKGAKALGFDWRDVFDPLREDALLRKTLEPVYRRLLDAVRILVEDALGASIEVTDDLVLTYLRDAGREISGITETTRQAVAAALKESQALGESIPDTAKRLRNAAAFQPTRATTIARTELGHAANLAALTSYKASGAVVGVRVFDGDGCGVRAHDDPRKADGLVLTLEEAASVPTLAHPRCRRAFGAVVDASEMEGAA